MLNQINPNTQKPSFGAISLISLTTHVAKKMAARQNHKAIELPVGSNLDKVKGLNLEKLINETKRKYAKLFKH